MLTLCVAEKLCPRGELSTYDTTRDVPTESLTNALTAGDGGFSCVEANSKGSTRSAARGCISFIPIVQRAVIRIATRLKSRRFRSSNTDLHWGCLER